MKTIKMNNGKILLVELIPYTTTTGSKEVFIKLTINQIGVSFEEIKEIMSKTEFKELNEYLNKNQLK